MYASCLKCSYTAGHVVNIFSEFSGKLSCQRGRHRQSGWSSIVERTGSGQRGWSQHLTGNADLCSTTCFTRCTNASYEPRLGRHLGLTTHIISTGSKYQRIQKI